MAASRQQPHGHPGNASSSSSSSSPSSFPPLSPYSCSPLPMPLSFPLLSHDTRFRKSVLAIVCVAVLVVIGGTRVHFASCDDYLCRANRTGQGQSCVYI
ncbi:hypothetical protein E2C01_073642 [Portunus trituberculatus]|uniref:Uncharacterized protein n=1 Tax=Portunus trituberculatus TaxID=210409 RepID=A0A5B7IB32_PORTR|nr:hypothetical protein [Portunus trituberculatus]